MQTLVLKSDSAVDIKLVAGIAKKMGIKAKILTEEEKEDFGMLSAIKKGRTGHHIDSEDFVKMLRK